MENIDQQIRKNAVTNGLILGIIMVVLTIFSFYMITALTSSFWMVVASPVIFAIIIPIVIVIFFCIILRKKIGGYWVFKQATTGIFIMFLVAFIVQIIGRDLIFAKIVEPNMVEKTQDAMVNATQSFMEKSGTDQAKIDEKMDDIKKQFEAQKNTTIGKTIQGYLIALLFLFVFALIFAAIFKRAPLKFLSDDTDQVV